VVATNSDTYILTMQGFVYAIGWDNYGELGNGTAKDTYTTTPVLVDLGATITSLPSVMPASTGLAIDSNGHVWGWGANTDGALCSLGEQETPTELSFSNVTLAIGAGGHAQYYAADTLWACGDNTYGELGDDTTTSSSTAVQVCAVGVTACSGLPAGTITALTASYGASGAVVGGNYYDWGLNDNGQLGIGSTRNATSPAAVGLSSAVVQVSQGGSDTSNGQTLVVLQSGGIEGWGSDQYGQLCDGTTQGPVLTPQTITPPSGHTWTQVDSGGATSYAIDSSDGLWSCGNNQDGQLGNGKDTARSKPYKNKQLSGVTQVSSTAGNVAATAN